MNYTSDRSFTDFIHQSLALPKIYTPLQWEPVDLSPEQSKRIDMRRGIDYVFKDKKENYRTVQERFRESKYEMYSDFTIRYRRDGNKHAERHESEFYKLDAMYFLYGIVNGTKLNRNECNDFLKFAIIDLKALYKKIEDQNIVIRDNNQNKCKIKDGKIICPVKYNKDDSSSFFPIEIPFLIQLWDKEIVKMQKGFL